MKIEMLRNGICWTYIQWIGSDKSAKQIHEAVKAVFKDSRVYVEVGGTLILIHYPLTVAQKDSVEEVAPSNAVRVEVGDWVVIDDGLYSEQKAISFLKNEEVLDGLRENSNSLRAKQVRRYIFWR